MIPLFFFTSITQMDKPAKPSRLVFPLLLLLSISAGGRADTLTLYDCQRLAIDNYALSESAAAYQKLLDLETAKLNADRLPAISINGQAVHQSDVFEIPFSPPGFELEELPNEKYQAAIDFRQTIYDGGLTGARKNAEAFRTEMNVQQVASDSRQLVMRTNEVYFTILLLQQAGQIIENSLDLLKAKTESLEAGVESGVALETDLLKMRAEILDVEKELIRNAHNLKKAKEMLSILTGRVIDDSAILKTPELARVHAPDIENHPDVRVLEKNQRLLASQKNIIQAGNRPKVNIFGTAGLGYPNPYNFYDINLSPFYVAGIQLQWKFWDWKKSAADKQALDIRYKIIERSKINLMKNIHVKLEDHLGEMAQYEEMIARDEQIAATRERIRELASKQLDAGVITPAAYLESVNAERSARLDLENRRILQVKARISYLTEAGETGSKPEK